jgi:hypothetical protein
MRGLVLRRRRGAVDSGTYKTRNNMVATIETNDPVTRWRARERPDEAGVARVRDSLGDKALGVPSRLLPCCRVAMASPPLVMREAPSANLGGSLAAIN